MKTLRQRLIRLAYEKPELRDELLPLVSRTKKANWWGVVHVHDQGDHYSLFVGGENPLHGWSSLDYILKEMNGRLGKLKDDTVAVLKRSGVDVRGGNHRTFGTTNKDAYFGWSFYGKKDLDLDLLALMKNAGLKAYVRDSTAVG
jgi:hypothetical protein